MKARSLQAHATALAALLALPTLAGCVTRSYKRAEKKTPPAVASVSVPQP